MKPLFLTILILAVPLSAFADTDATGYDWVEYAEEEKHTLMTLMFDFYELEKDIYSIEKGIGVLDLHYSSAYNRVQDNPDLDADVFLSVPCLLTFGAIIANSNRETELTNKPLTEDDEGIKMGFRTVTELSVVYVGMPKEDLAKAGYTKLLQKDYHKDENEERITYLNWTTKDPDDLVTFYIVDGKVKGWKGMPSN